MADNQSQIAGLFMTPELYQQQQDQQALQQAAQLAQMSGRQRADMGMLMAGQQVSRGLAGALGAQDPQLQAIQQQQKLLSGVDFTNLASLQEGARAAVAAGRPDIAQALAAKALEQQRFVEDKQAAREQQLTMFRERLAQQKDLADQANQTKMMIAQMTKALAGANSDLQRQILEEKLGALKQKQTDLEEARTTKLKNTVDTADNVIQVAQEAKNLTSGWTTGLTGTLAGLKPGSDAYNLQAKLDTIKSQLGFSQLQAMRDASPTGGALGQVSNQEIKYLQAALANLDKAQNSKDLKDNIDKVITHYSKWRDAAVGKLEEKGVATPAKKQVIKLD